MHDKYIKNLGDISEDQVAHENMWLNKLTQRYYNLKIRIDNTLKEGKDQEKEKCGNELNLNMLKMFQMKLSIEFSLKVLI